MVDADLEQRHRALATASRAERARVFATGSAPDPAALEGWEYRGWNTSWIAGLLRIRKFVKAFFRADAGAVREYGCNSRTEQNGLEEEWRAQPSDEEPGWFGFYLVEPAPAKRHPDALLLDYGRVGNGFPTRLLRDYVVSAAPGNDDLLLGKAYLALGPLRIPVSYFVLARRRQAPAPPEPPSG